MDSDMVLGRSQVWMSPSLQRTEQATQTGTVPVEVWPSGSNKVPDLGIHMDFDGNMSLDQQPVVLLVFGEHAATRAILSE